MSQIQHVKTSIETLDNNGFFKLHLTFNEGGKRPLLLGMHLTVKDKYTTPTPQLASYFRSVFRKFGNEFLRKIAPNDYFSIKQRKFDNIEYKSLCCKFIANEEFYLDIVEAHAITHVWDQLMHRFDLSLLYSSGKIFLSTKSQNGLIQRPIELENFDEGETQHLPEIVHDFINRAVDIEK